ncbi:MAG: FAD-dependent oxidoreductase [Myxococcales bacterium]|nr:FAD-dependent oxidoreductase [Myxococcales bacterium]
MALSARRDIADSADFVVVGSGAAGAMAARWLAAAGHQVVLVEEGDQPVAWPFESPNALRMVHGGGRWTTSGGDAIALTAGNCVGGSTAIGYGVHAQLPEEVYESWVQLDPSLHNRLGYSEIDLARTQIESDMAVEKVPRELWGASGQLLLSAFAGSAEPVWRGAPGCRGTGRCVAGCPTRGMSSVDRVLWPIAQRLGARLHSQARIERILIEAGRAVGVIGRTIQGSKVSITARRAVFLCAGALNTPLLLRRSSISCPSWGWQLHADALVTAMMPAPLDDEQAAGLAIAGPIPEVDTATIAAVSILPRQRAMQLPGAGLALEQRMEHLNHLAIWRVTVPCQARGGLENGLLGPRFNLKLATSDRLRLLAAVSVAADGMLRQGAIEVYPQVHGVPAVATTVDDVAQITSVAPTAGAIALHANSFFGGLRVDERYCVPGIKGLVVADAAALPACTVVPPMATVMAVAMAAVQRWV